MSEIILPKMQNEFGIMSGLLVLICCCVYPDDVAKRQEMTAVLNVTILHIVKYGVQDKATDIPEHKKIEADIERFGQGVGIVVPPEFANISPEKVGELIRNAALKIATDSLDLPKDIEKFLLHADKPASFNNDFKVAVKGLVTAAMIVIKLMQMNKLGVELRGDASLNKAIELLMDSRSKCPIASETNIRKSWKVYRKSVHIGFGLLMAYVFARETKFIKEYNNGKGYMDDLVSPITMGAVIMFNKLLQDWLLGFKLSKHASPSSAGRLVKANQLWLVPKKVKKPANFKLERLIDKLPPLSEWELEILRQKRRM